MGYYSDVAFAMPEVDFRKFVNAVYSKEEYAKIRNYLDYGMTVNIDDNKDVIVGSWAGVKFYEQELFLDIARQNDLRMAFARIGEDVEDIDEIQIGDWEDGYIWDYVQIERNIDIPIPEYGSFQQYKEDMLDDKDETANKSVEFDNL